MAFANFSCIEDLVKKYKLRFFQGDLIPPDLTAPLFSDYFREELAFNQRKLPIGRSEIRTGEILLIPILREVWKPYADDLALFSMPSYVLFGVRHWLIKNHLPRHDLRHATPRELAPIRIFQNALHRPAYSHDFAHDGRLSADGVRSVCGEYLTA